MYLEIVSPEATLFTGEVDSVKVPGSAGDFQMLNNHAPIVSTLKKGIVKISGKIKMQKIFFKSKLFSILTKSVYSQFLLRG